ncbi:DNA-binding protein, excisionase family [Polaromonas sp. CF318]|jgi:excisionase family DNA binding protein|uniref:response regulator n=1 Tax=unclassified Polaromonas TaxID=2638319 RepID=UPI000271010A|nr:MULTISPECIES: response regulator [unclassified Polaromonas]EJL84858.1 DNA-binding protein, excisionase family [Polaromonas sp. CF318]SDN99341.1 DNA binding domain-containing protein, excisionase family [Polaromonas sp. JS666]
MREPKSFEAAITASDFSSEDYCGTSYAAKLLGLSVATVQSLVEKGEIEAWKTLGGHRRIALQSINAYLAKNSPQLSRADTDPKHRLRVLMVEDDENTRELYRCQFEDWDLPVDCTWMPSALEAMMDIASMRPDLLITDLSMPGVDGIEMLKACKRNLQLADMQIVVISGLAPEAVKARGGLPPEAHLLQKPINFDWLHGYVTALVTANRKWRH